jgi:hypothetical protein
MPILLLFAALSRSVLLVCLLPPLLSCCIASCTLVPHFVEVEAHIITPFRHVTNLHQCLYHSEFTARAPEDVLRPRRAQVQQVRV